jgi:hypothetical protein
MLTFTTPTGFKDVSEYTFSNKERQVVVRYTQKLGSAADLLSVAKDYAGELQEYLRAENVEVSALKQRADGNSYVTIEGTFTRERAVERSGFILLRNGTSLQLSLRSASGDKLAENEFLQLIQTVHAAPSALDDQSRSFATPDENPPVHRAGPVLITLPAGYHDHTLMRFQNAAGTLVSLKYEQDEAVATALEGKGLLGNRIQSVDDWGQPFAYEVGENPWAARLASKISKLRPKSAAKIAATKTRDLAPNKRVIVRVYGPASDIAAADLAVQIIESVKLEGETPG